MRFTIPSLFILATGAIAAPATGKRHVLHEKRDVIPEHWRRNVKLHPDSTLPMRIALTQSNLDRAEEFLMDVSHPTSPNFGKHWSAKEVANMFAPSKETVAAVTDWLKENGVTNFAQSQSLNWINANVTAGTAERLLQTDFFEYIHESGKSHVACEKYYLPEHLRDHVDFITPTVHFDAKVSHPTKKRSNEPEPPVQSGKAKSIGSATNNIAAPKTDGKIPFGTVIEQLKQCDTYITPDCLRALYLIPPNFPKHSGNSYGIVEYTPQSYLQTDLNTFFANYSRSLIGKSPIFNSIDGGTLQSTEESFNFNGESDLDLEYAITLVYPQQVFIPQSPLSMDHRLKNLTTSDTLSIGDLIEGASFNNFLDAIDGSYCTYENGDDPTQDGTYPDPFGPGYEGPENCGGFAATKVISTSYAYNEADLTPFYENRQCHEYLKLGLQGVTILYSSGDYGVGGNNDECISNSGNYTAPGANYGIFNPSFPSTCPYVTSVGATQVATGSTVTQPEQAAESVIYSGGGFSNVFPMPSYQSNAVKSYFKNHNPPYGADRYNNSQMTRGYPDLSANGVNYVVTVDGNFSRVFGTSASSPVVGSILTLINSARMIEKKGPIGFINPVIYEDPSILNDVTRGGNQGCGTPGFTSVQGWDPVTGLGTPNFPKMVAKWLKLP